jgi:alpha-galactosidase
MDDASGNDASGDAGGRGDSAAPDAAALGIDPSMGWSSSSFVRQGPTQSVIEAQAKALHDSGLSDHGYKYANIDDYYYLNPSTNVDANGWWVVDSKKFPNGMAAVASFVHGLGLRFAMYLTPGIPVAAVTQNTPIKGTTYHGGHRCRRVL